MKEYFFKRALPFTLTFALGAAVGGFFQLLRARDAGWFQKRHGYSSRGRLGCDEKFRRRAYELRSGPPVILFKPDARIPAGLDLSGFRHGVRPALVSVTFGADGKVRGAVSEVTWSPELSEASEEAARQIRFIPATVDGAPTTVTEEVEIRFYRID